MKAFGHGEYVRLNTSAILGQSGADPDSPLPNLPYTPTIKAIKVSYKAEASVGFSELGNKERLFHIEPYGTSSPSLSTNPTLLAQYDSQGYVYLGIKELVPPQNLSILFQIADGTADSHEDDVAITWSFLSKSGWVEFDPTQILSDTTEKLQISGIIEFEIPQQAVSDSSIMPIGLHWIRGEAKNIAAVGQFVSLHTQAALVTFADRENDPKHLSQPLSKEQINKLAVKNAAIKSVYQPSSSWGGKMKEEGDNFYIRTSERLRHKNRAVNTWDYERLVLERFPSS